jgi:NAD(P)-dependent dehydrogenase (short-subunit alcohol dehydrogenase family)
MKMLEGKVAIVMGASEGIGKAAAQLFAAHGARLILNARREDPLRAVAESIAASGGHALACPGDATDPQTSPSLVRRAMSTFGRLDIAFNNVGVVGEMAPLAEIAPEQWTFVVEANLTSAFLAARAQIPAMLSQGGGSLIFTSSFVGNSVGMPGMSVYGAAKAGLLGLVKGITADYAHRGIRANALLPGGTRTQMLTARTDEELAWVNNLHALKRIAEPEEIANAALFLASDLSSFVTGSALWADGGNAAIKG